MTAVTLNGNAYSDDGTQSRDMRFGGHQQWLLPMLQDAMTEVEAATDAAVSADSSADAAAASAVSAANYAAGLNATSTSANDIGTGSKTWTTQTGKQFGAGGYVQIIRQSDTTMWMIGQVTAYNSGTGSITVSVEDSNGSGNYSGWDIRVSGKRGAQGAIGIDGTVSLPYVAKTSAYTADAADKGKLIDCTSGTWALGYQAPATLGANWFIYVRNSGTGDITHTPTSGTIDGLASFISYPESVRLVVCDGVALRSIPLVGGSKQYTSTPGSNYIVPPGVRLRIVGIGGGAGGQSGSGNCATTGSGGWGGGGGGFREVVLKIPAGTSVAVAIGAGGAGATGVVGGQVHGTPGGNTTFGSYFSANRGMASVTGSYGGGDYYGGIYGGGTLASSGRGDLAGSSGASGGSALNGSGANASVRGGGGGGGGGGLSGDRSGGVGGKSGQYDGPDPGGAAAGSGGTTGGAGTVGGTVSDFVSSIGAGGGGGGGGSGTAGAGGAGGNGGTPGGGGGGGGAGFTAFAGGSGGAGGRGELWVIEEV